MFNHSDESIIQWFINLESTCQKRIFDKSNEWFQNPLELTDIESAFSSPIKVYKSCKYYLLRSNIKTNYLNGNPMIKIFNENEENVNVEDINAETNFISILEIQGIKFTTRNFQIEVEVKQIMTMNVDIIFENCLIKKHHHNSGLIQDVNEDTEAVGVTEVTDNIKKDIKNNDIVDLEEVPEIVFDDDDNTDDTSTNNISENILNDIIENSKSNNNDSLGIVSVLSNTTNEANKSNSKDMFDNSKNTSIESTDELDELNEITLDIEELLLENTNTLEIPVIKLKKPNEVYYDLFNKAKSKAREAKKLAIQSYLEAKKIKETYLLEDVDLSEEEDEDNF